MQTGQCITLSFFSRTHHIGQDKPSTEISPSYLPVEILAMVFHAWKDAARIRKKHGLRADWVRIT